MRYWAASTGLGKDYDHQRGEASRRARKLATKLWNVARFASAFWRAMRRRATPPGSRAADRWLLSRLQRLVERVTTLFAEYDYAAAKSGDRGLLLARRSPTTIWSWPRRGSTTRTIRWHEGARYTLRTALLTVLKLFAPFLPYVTEEIYLDLFADEGGSIHRSPGRRGDTASGDATMMRA